MSPKSFIFTYPEKPKPKPREATKIEYERANGRRGSLKRREVSRKEIDRLAARDSYRRCKACHTEDNLTVDHIIPLFHNGSNSFMNKQILCSTCNSIKGNKMPGKNGWWPDNLSNYKGLDPNSL